MAVDSYRYLARSMQTMYQGMPAIDEPPVFAPLKKPLRQCRVALLTSAGVYLKDSQESFDLEGERREPTWGDPSFRVIPSDVRQEQVGVAHLHINSADILEDLDVVLPIRTFRKLEAEGVIGELAGEHYSFMGYQDRALAGWRETYGPQLVQRLNERAVDVLLLAPA